MVLSSADCAELKGILYVGTGAGIIRPDLATGDGMYKSTDAGKTWTHLGLRDSQMALPFFCRSLERDLSRVAELS